MVSANFNISNLRYSPSFGNNTKTPNADAFLDAVKQQEKRDTEGATSSQTAVIPFLAAVVYDMVLIGDTLGARKKDPAGFKKILLKNFGKFSIATLAGMCTCSAINKYLDTKSDKNYKKLKEDFNGINQNTNAKLSEKLISSNYVGALYSPVSGNIGVGKNVLNDPISSLSLEKLLKHELVHAKQYETVARSMDGIKKINYAAMNTFKNNILQTPNAKEGFDAIYQDIQQNRDKFKDTKIRISGGSAEVGFVDYVEALHILMTNPDAGMNDIPMVIDAKHYQEIIDKKGRLSAEDEKKADIYYKAMLDYSPARSWMTAYNPWSSYRQNLLEKEAYKVNPSILTKMSDWFSK